MRQLMTDWWIVGCAVAMLLANSDVTPAGDSPAQHDHITTRDGLRYSEAAFQSGRGRVAFLGGSITEMDGYRPLVVKWLQQRFPHVDFTFVNAGIASTCSTTGAFRLQRDVLQPQPPDLLFVEFAVNDDQDAEHSPQECVRGMEGIVRHLRTVNPRADIVMIHFVNPEMLRQVQRGDVPVPIAAHERVAQHYGVPSINIAAALADRIASGEMTWEEYGGTHPGPAGNRLAADLVQSLLKSEWNDADRSTSGDSYRLPEELDSGAYTEGRFISPDRATFDDLWTWGEPNWSSIPGSLRSRFADRQPLHASDPGAALHLQFEGTAIGAYVLAGPDAGIVEAAIDDGPFRTVNLYHRFSRGLHYPRTVMFATDLQPGEHTLQLRIAADRDERSSGHAARILEFTAN